MTKQIEALKLAEEALHNTGNALICLTTTRKLRPMYQEMRDDAVEGCNKALAAIREALAEPVRRGSRITCVESGEKCVVWATSHTDCWVQFPDGHSGQYTYEQIGSLFSLDEQAEQEPAREFNHETQLQIAYIAGLADKSEAPVQPVKQEPVGVVESSEEWGVAGVLIAGLPIGTKLYAAPVDAKAIRAIKFEGDTGFRTVSEMIAEHKQDPKKAAAIEKAKMRIAEQKPVAVVEITYGREPECYVTGNIDDFPEGVFKLYAAPVRTKDLTDSEIATLIQRHTIDGKIMPFALCEAAIAADREKNK